jgi:hypothetical protein
MRISLQQRKTDCYFDVLNARCSNSMVADFSRTIPKGNFISFLPRRADALVKTK